MKIEPCPKCHKLPKVWIEKAQYQSKKLWWFRCPEHPINFEGGVTRFIALANWNRRINRAKFESYEVPREMRELLG